MVSVLDRNNVVAMPVEIPDTAFAERFLARELLGVVESASIAAARHMGQGNRELVDQAAVDAMRIGLNNIEMNGTIVIGEGERDEAGY